MSSLSCTLHTSRMSLLCSALADPASHQVSPAAASPCVKAAAAGGEHPAPQQLPAVARWRDHSEDGGRSGSEVSATDTAARAAALMRAIQVLLGRALQQIPPGSEIQMQIP